MPYKYIATTKCKDNKNVSPLKLIPIRRLNKYAGIPTMSMLNASYEFTVIIYVIENGQNNMGNFC